MKREGRYPICEYETNSDERVFAIFDGKSLDELPKPVHCGRRAFFCHNDYREHHIMVTRLLLPLLDLEHSPECGWERDHDRNYWLAQLRKQIGDNVNHWLYLCPRHWLYLKYLHCKIEIEDYIERYVWRGFCWCAPWHRLLSVFRGSRQGCCQEEKKPQ